jgi:hypothetical protein
MKYRRLTPIICGGPHAMMRGTNRDVGDGNIVGSHTLFPASILLLITVSEEQAR